MRKSEISKIREALLGKVPRAILLYMIAQFYEFAALPKRLVLSQPFANESDFADPVKIEIVDGNRRTVAFKELIRFLDSGIKIDSRKGTVVILCSLEQAQFLSDCVDFSDAEGGPHVLTDEYQGWMQMLQHWQEAFKALE